MRARRPPMAAVVATFALAGALGLGADARGQRGRPAERVSDIVFPPGGGARFDHAIEAHRELACERCHAGASGSRRAEESLAPPDRVCAGCHEEPFPRAAPAPPPRIRFSHRVHAREGVRCLSCHEGVGDPADRAARHLPSMRSCFRCHGGEDGASGAPGECTTCHLMRPDGLMRSRYPEGWLNPPRWLFGMHHDADWLVRHRWIAADRGELCATCHEESECADCHDGRVRPSRVHPNDWLTVHAQMARRNEPECTSCHTTQSFCAECHSRLGISLIAAPNVRSPSRFHPPADVWTRGPNLHAREASRSMAVCTSCHVGRDCTVCHGVLGIGAGISPHPPGFGGECGRYLRANDRACRSCHVDLERLRAICR